MKKFIFIALSLFFLMKPTCSFANILNDTTPLPVLGSIVEHAVEEDGTKYIVRVDSPKVHSPIEGTIFFVGYIKEYGLTAIIKNPHKVVIIGKLDRATVIKNQYVFAGDALGTVEYHSEVPYFVHPVRPPAQRYANTMADVSQYKHNPHAAEQFQQKFVTLLTKGIPEQTLLGLKKTVSNFRYRKDITYNKLKELLHIIGFNAKDIPTMYCIAKWESNLNPKALNFNTNNTVDVGLFQINSTWFQKCNSNLAGLYDEEENSRCALTVLKKQGFTAWSSYNKNKKHGDYCEI